MLALLSPMACVAGADDYPIGFPPDCVGSGRRRPWGDGWGTGSFLDLMGPSVARDVVSRAVRTLRQSSASPGQAHALVQRGFDHDVRDLLPLVAVPTLVLHRTEATPSRRCAGLYVASTSPAPAWWSCPGDDNFPFLGEDDALTDEIEEFLTGERGITRPIAGWRRSCSPTSSLDPPAVEVGDQSGSTSLRTTTRWCVASSTGSPAARSRPPVTASWRPSTTRPEHRLWASPAGRHRPAGPRTHHRDPHRRDPAPHRRRRRGIAVHIVARVSRRPARPGARVVGVPPLVSGSGIEFADLGPHDLKGSRPVEPLRRRQAEAQASG